MALKVFYVHFGNSVRYHQREFSGPSNVEGEDCLLIFPFVELKMFVLNASVFFFYMCKFFVFF